MEGVLKSNDAAPHTAVINVAATIFEKSPTGEHGRPMARKHITVAIGGEDRMITERKLNEFLEEVKRLCQ